MAIVDGSGTQITSFGGGTQYTDAAVAPANPVGGTIEWNEGGTWRTVSTAKPLPVTATVTGGTMDLIKWNGTALGTPTNFGTTPTAVVAGSVNASIFAGTTALTQTSSALDINLKTIAAALTLSTVTTVGTVTNLSQMNGVAISMGTGIMGTGTQRVVIASDNDPVTVKQATAANLKAQVAQLASISTSATLQNVVAATGNGSTLSVDGMSAAIFTVTGTFTATIDFEGTEDGTNYSSLSTVKLGTSTIAVNTTTTGVYEVSVAGLQLIRARVTWTSGTSVTVTAHTVPVPFNPKVVNANIVANTATNQSTNIAQINGVTPLMGNGITGTGSLRVTVASDNTAFSVNATLAAETTKVIGTVNQGTSPWVTSNATTSVVGNGTSAAAQRVTIANDSTGIIAATLSAETTKVIGVTRTADGSGNLLTSNSTTYTAKFGLDSNLLGTLGTAFTTAGFIDIKGADGNVFVRQATASSLNATVVGTGTFVVQATLAIETTKVIGTVRIVGNAGAIIDGATAASVPANGIYQGVRGTTALPAAVTDGQLVGATADKFGRQVVIPQAPRDLIGTQITTISSSTVETTIFTAIASTFLDLVSIMIVNTSATSTRIDIRDTTAGSIVMTLYAPAGDLRGISWQVPFPQTTVNTNWTATCGTSVADVRFTVQAVKNK